MWELGYKESWALKNWCFRTVVLEKTLESPLDYKEIQPVHPKGNQSWMFIGRTDAEAETPILWPPDAKNWLMGKDPDAGKDWRWEEKGNDRGCSGWMSSPTQWTWVWARSGSWWWTGKSGMLQSMGLQRVWHNWATELKILRHYVLFSLLGWPVRLLFFSIIRTETNLWDNPPQIFFCYITPSVCIIHCSNNTVKEMNILGDTNWLTFFGFKCKFFFLALTLFFHSRNIWPYRQLHKRSFPLMGNINIGFPSFLTRYKEAQRKMTGVIY